MGRGSAGWCGLFALIGLACQSAEAGDLKSATQSTKALLVTPTALPAAPANSGRQPAGTVGLFENGYGVKEARVSGREKEKPPREHKTITLYHFNSQFGEVKVQPVFGRVNGAQLSLGF
jgi:hypothetical protein